MKILHITDRLGIGGTEILLQNTISELVEYEHVIVYLSGSEELHLPDFKKYPLFSLGHTSSRYFLRSIFRLRSVLRKIKPDVIHAHSFMGSIISRFAIHGNGRLITSLHSLWSQDAYEKNILALSIDRITAKRQDDIIAVSMAVLSDFNKYIHFSGRKHVLYNFIPLNFHNSAADKVFEKTYIAPTKCVAVGGLKSVKNYLFILDAFSLLPKGKFTLDIIGDGPEFDKLEKRIIMENLPVKLLGSRPNASDLFDCYSVFIQASHYEGFGIAACEAILSGLIPVLSDIPTHREITANKAIYFDLRTSNSLAQCLVDLDSFNFSKNMIDCVDHVKKITSPLNYFSKIREIYSA